MRNPQITEKTEEYVMPPDSPGAQMQANLKVGIQMLRARPEQRHRDHADDLERRLREIPEQTRAWAASADHYSQSIGEPEVPFTPKVAAFVRSLLTFALLHGEMRAMLPSAWMKLRRKIRKIMPRIGRRRISAQRKPAKQPGCFEWQIKARC